MTPRLDTLRLRLSVFYAGFLTVALLLFSAVVYSALVMAEAEENEPEADKDREIQAIRHRMLTAVAAGVPIATLLAALSSSFMTRRTLRILGDIVRTAGEVGPEQLEARIPCDPDADIEIQRLVHSLNGMLERIDRAVNGLRRFTADAAHELRTPLASIMGELEICLRRPRDETVLRTVMESSLEELQRLGQLVDILLMLARSDAGELPMTASSVDVKQLVAQVAAPYEELATEWNLELRLPQGSPLQVRTDPLLLSRAVANLLDNACKFSKPGGYVQVDCVQRENNIEISVADTGPGLSEQDQQNIFKRFYRSAKHRGSVEGFGLGLALTREFINALHGQVTLKNREGGGVQACIILPVGN
jgi:heavy metal sensor kinase